MELHVISNWFKDHPKKREYLEKRADKSLFPVVNFETKTIKANKLQKIILEFGKTFDEKMTLLKKYIGAYVSDNPSTWERKIPDIKFIVFKVTPSLAVVEPFMHGWYSVTTRQALEGAIQHYKPKTVIELGVWFGQSTVGILQSSPHKLNYYGFDYFTPTATNPDYVTMTPIDKLFIDHFRLETAVANVAPYSKKHNIHYVLHSVLDSYKVLDVVPDLVFIDAIKDTKELQTVIDAYLKINPDIVIVGDDYIVEDVRRAVKKYSNYVAIGETAYILTNREIPDKFPEPVSDFSKYPELNLTPAEKAKVPKSMKPYIHEY